MKRAGYLLAAVIGLSLSAPAALAQEEPAAPPPRWAFFEGQVLRYERTLIENIQVVAQGSRQDLRPDFTLTETLRLEVEEVDARGVARAILAWEHIRVKWREVPGGPLVSYDSARPPAQRLDERFQPYARLVGARVIVWVADSGAVLKSEGVEPLLQALNRFTTSSGAPAGVADGNLEAAQAAFERNLSHYFHVLPEQPAPVEEGWSITTGPIHPLFPLVLQERFELERLQIVSGRRLPELSTKVSLGPTEGTDPGELTVFGQAFVIQLEHTEGSGMVVWDPHEQRLHKLERQLDIVFTTRPKSAPDASAVRHLVSRHEVLRLSP